MMAMASMFAGLMACSQPSTSGDLPGAPLRLESPFDMDAVKFKTYGNNQQGQILLEQNPPRFTPDVKEYHEMLLKGSCDARGKFNFENVAAGDYYVMAFIIWKTGPAEGASSSGGAVMKRIRVEPNSTNVVRMD